MALDLTIIKKHPVATGAAILVGGAILFLVLKGQGGGGQIVTGSTGVDPAVVQANLQQAALAQQAQAQAAQEQFQLQAQQQTIQGQLSLASLQASLDTHKTDAANATALALAQMQTQIAQGQTAVQSTLADAQARTSLMTAEANAYATKLTAENQMPLAQLAASVQTKALDYDFQKTQLTTSAAVTISGQQTDAAKYIAKKQAGASQLGSILGFGSKLLGAFI